MKDNELTAVKEMLVELCSQIVKTLDNISHEAILQCMHQGKSKRFINGLIKYIDLQKEKFK